MADNNFTLSESGVWTGSFTAANGTETQIAEGHFGITLPTSGKYMTHDVKIDYTPILATFSTSGATTTATAGWVKEGEVPVTSGGIDTILPADAADNIKKKSTTWNAGNSSTDTDDSVIVTLSLNPGYYNGDYTITLSEVLPDITGSNNITTIADGTSSQILTGYSAYDDEGKLIAGSMSILYSDGDVTINPSSSGYTIDGGAYLANDITIKAVTDNLTASMIAYGSTAKIGYDGDDDAIKSVIGTFTQASTSTATNGAATTAQILKGYSAWVDGTEVSGEIEEYAGAYTLG